MSHSVVCYCHHVSHVLNLGRIPALLAAAGWRVRWLNAFPARDFPLAIEPGIAYAYDIPLHAVGNEEADLYLTPFVGQSAHFPRRAKRVHFLVSLTSLEGVYDEGMFDHYDVIACAGRHHIEEFAALGGQREWRGKWLLPVGYPKLDGQRRLLAASKLAPPDAPLTVVFAPTHAYYVNQQFSVLGRYGERIVESLIGDGVRVIFRPHVESWRDQDRPVVERIVSRFQDNPLFVLDRSGNYFESYAQSHLMLTDISGTGFTYAFTFGRPALFFAPDAESERSKTGIQFTNRESIGLVIRSIDDLLPKVHQMQSQIGLLQERIGNFRDKLVFNVGSSETAFVEIAKALLAGRPAADWKKIDPPYDGQEEPVKVSVGMLTYNQASHVREAIEGIFAQTYRIDEFIISDDCSADDTWKVIQETVAACQARPNKVRNCIVRRNERNLGLIPHFNVLLGELSNDLIVVNAGDDISLPHRVATIVADYIRAKKPRHYLCHSSVEIIGDGRVWTPPVIEQSLTVEQIATALALHIGATESFTRALYMDFGPIVRRTYEDLVLGFRAALTGHYHFIDQPLMRYRVGGLSSPGRTDTGDEKERQHLKETLLQRASDAFQAGRLDLVELIYKHYQAAGLVLGRASRNLAYPRFLALHALARHEAQAFDAYFASLGGAPRFEIVVCHDGDEARLARTIGSASRWLYDHFTLTVLAPGDVPTALRGNARIAWQKVGAGGTARFWPEIRARFAASEADWLIVIEAGDELAAHALLYLAEHALRMPQAVALYVDEDSIDAEGKPERPLLKPDFSPDYFLACDYLGDAVALRKTAVEAIDGIRLSDNDPLRGALLRLFARYGGAAFGHVADVLWHRHPLRCLNRQLLDGTVEPALQEILPQAKLAPGWLPGTARIDYPPPGTPAVLMIVEACADPAVMERLIGNLWQNRAYAPVELVVFVAPDLPEAVMRFLQEIDSVSPPGLAIFANPPGLARTARIAAAIENSQAELILLARPDIEPTDAGWLAALAGHASRPEIGLVAPRLVDRHGRLIGNALLLGMEGFAVGLGHGESFDAPGQSGRLLTPQNPSALSADIAMFSRAALEAAGGFDTHLGATAALIDLALRMKQNGRSHLWTPHVTLACLHASAEKLSPAEESLLLERWLPQMARDPAYNINLSRKTPFALTEHPQVGKLRLPWKPLPRLMAFPADNMGCGHYRVIEPFNAALAAGRIDGYLDFTHYDPFDMAVFEADTLFLQRQVTDAQLDHVRSYRRFFDLKLVYELDDLITNLPVTSLHKGGIPKDIAKRLRKGLELCDRFVVTTEPLKEAYRSLNADIRVIPNYLDREKWGDLAPRRRVSDKPRVGWAGGISHTGDLALIIDLVKATAAEVDWVFMGFCLEEIKPYVKELIPGVLTPQYPAKLATLDLDLAIAPIVENHFNDCKSHLKLLEYGILGYPVIATDFGPYRRAKDFPGITLVKNRHKDWLEAVRSHIHDLDASARRGDLLREHVRRHHMLQDHLDEWLSAWFDFPPKL